MKLIENAIKNAKARYASVLRLHMSSASDIPAYARERFVEGILAQFKLILPSEIPFDDVVRHVRSLDFRDTLAFAMAINGPRHTALECGKMKLPNYAYDVDTVADSGTQHLKAADPTPMNPELTTALAKVKSSRAATDKIYAVLEKLVTDLDQIGFADETSPVNGGDCVDTICQHIGALRSAARLARATSGPYLVGHWGHIFAGSPAEQTVRLVIDRHEREIVAMQHKTACGYVDASRPETADVLDSILTANEQALEAPEEWGLEFANSLPAWARPREASDAIAQFEREIADCGVQFGLLIGELAALVDGAPLETESELRWDVVDEAKTHLGANNANDSADSLPLPGCIHDSSEGDQDPAIAAAEEWVTANISNGDTRTIIAAAIALSSANATEARIRDLVPAPSHAPGA